MSNSLQRRVSIAAAVLVLLVFVVRPARAQTFTTLASFQGTNGSNPFYVSLIQGTDGDYKGTTELGGIGTCFFSDGCGTVFKISPSGRLTKLYSFCRQGDCSSGDSPLAGLLQATDGNTYGTAWYGGVNYACNLGCGAIYKITPKGQVTTLYSFCAQQNCADGSAPVAPLIQAFDRNFYGTTSANGLGGGTVFKITPTGQLTTLYSFCQQLPGCTDGASPSAGLVQGIDGSLYGTTVGGGAHGWGTVFKVTLKGKLTTMHSFAGPPTDGGNPYGGLARGSDGIFYGITYQGGIGSCSSGCGTVFKITRDGAFTTLHSFNGTDGILPVAGLVQATDGNFYGTTIGGGSYSAGTIFTISANGALDTLHSFCLQSNCDDGSTPSGALFQATNGILYGTTSYGGKDNDGTVFSLSVGLSPFVAFVHDSGKIGSKSDFLGQGFTGTSAVSFNGTAANFVVHSDTYLTATVPGGATTGFVTVTTPGGTLQSNKQFRVEK